MNFTDILRTAIHALRGNWMRSALTSLGVIIGNRDFFPDQLVAEARYDVQKLFAERGIRPVMVSPEETNLIPVVAVDQLEDRARSNGPGVRADGHIADADRAGHRSGTARARRVRPGGGGPAVRGVSHGASA